jgi:hypothetical protein
MTVFMRRCRVVAVPLPVLGHADGDGDRVVLRKASNVRIACDAWARISC